MAWKLADLFVAIRGDQTMLDKSLQTAKAKLEGLSAWTVAKGTLLADAIKGSGKGLFDLISGSVDKAAGMEDVLARVASSFGRYQGPMLSFADAMARKYGQSKETILSHAEEIQTAFRIAGMSGEEASNKALEIAEQAASFAHNTGSSLTDVFGEWNVGIEGMNKSLKLMGAELDDIAVTNQARKMGFGMVNGEYLKKDLMAARLEVMKAIQATRQGTMGGGDNRYHGLQNQMWGRIEGIMQKVGEAALPIWETALRSINHLLEGASDWLDGMQPAMDAIGDKIAKWGGYFALVFEDHHAWELVQSELSDLWNNAIDLGKRAFQGLFNFLGDAMGQLGNVLAASINNALSKTNLGWALGLSKMDVPGLDLDFSKLTGPMGGFEFKQSELTGYLQQLVDGRLEAAGLGGLSDRTKAPAGVGEPSVGSPSIAPGKTGTHGVEDFAKYLQDAAFASVDPNRETAANTRRIVELLNRANSARLEPPAPPVLA